MNEQNRQGSWEGRNYLDTPIDICQLPIANYLGTYQPTYPPTYLYLVTGYEVLYSIIEVISLLLLYS